MNEPPRVKMTRTETDVQLKFTLGGDNTARSIERTINEIRCRLLGETAPPELQGVTLTQMTDIDTLAWNSRVTFDFRGSNSEQAVAAQAVITELLTEFNISYQVNN